MKKTFIPIRYRAYLAKAVLIFGLGLFISCSSEELTISDPKAPSVLVFYKTAGYYHTSIPDGLGAIRKLGMAHQININTTNNAAHFTLDSLIKYQAVVFFNTTGDVLEEKQQEAFEQYIRAGGGFAGIHAATDTEPDWPWYHQLVGAYFDNHPAIQKATVEITDPSHPATKHLPLRWERTDEWYNFKNIYPNIQVLARLDEKTYTGGNHGNNHPIAWYHTFDGGRAFYTAGGHTSTSYLDSLFLQHMWGGISYAMGK